DRALACRLCPYMPGGNCSHLLDALAAKERACNGGISSVSWVAARAQRSVMPISVLTAEEAQSIAQEAYIHLYPLVIMDVTRKHFSNIEAGKRFGRGPMNTFSHGARSHRPRCLSTEAALERGGRSIEHFRDLLDVLDHS